MAISANTVWEVRTAGNDTNGGAFVTGASGTDYSQQDNKNTVGSDISTTDAVANGTTTITSATANFGTTIVGNIIYLQGGTGALAATRRQVTARASTTSITVDAAVAAGTGITMNIGGAMLSPGGIGTLSVSGNKIYVKSGSYSITSATANISGGCFLRSLTEISIIGYDTVRDDDGTPPVFTASGISSFTMFTGGAANSAAIISNISINGADLTSSRGINWAGNVRKVVATNFSNNAFLGSSASFYDCIATSCASAAAFGAGIIFVNCVAHSNAFSGFAGGGTAFINCLSYNNSGASSDGFTISGNNILVQNCTAYGNGRDGFRMISASEIVVNCIAEDNTGIGFHASADSDAMHWLNNAAFSNGTDFDIGTGDGCYNTNPITGSASFFTNAAGADFSLNNNAGGGADVRAAGYPGTFADGQIGYLDVGAVQHQDPASSGGAHSAVF